MTLKGILNWLVGLPVAVAGVGFAVANRQWVTISFDPLNRVHPFATVDMPLWALVFAGVFIGIFVGWYVAWRGNAKHRWRGGVWHCRARARTSPRRCR